MIILIHDNKVVSRVVREDGVEINRSIDKSHISATLSETALIFPDELILWCHKELFSYVQLSKINEIFHHKRVMASYGSDQNSFLPSQLGYIDRTCFLKINKEVVYPTWLMSSNVGGIHASVLNLLRDELVLFENFNYFLNSLSKRGMDYGLFCYSDPRLLSRDTHKLNDVEQASMYDLFKFIKQHHKWIWVYFLTLSYFVNERRITLIPLFNSLRYERLKPFKLLENINVLSSRRVIEKREIDVIIPTIGRKKYLYDVLKDLSKQTILPKNVIIVEQNPSHGSVSELDYLTNKEWPFSIKHTFTHQAGVCNARNIALSKVTSEWTLLGDDDNRFEPDLIEQFFNRLEQYGVHVGISVYLQPQEKQTYLYTSQTGIFGAGNGIMKSSLLKKVKFDMRYEFNYGEDSDFGQQLRNIGEDVIFFADIKITHLKAPVGGYRTKIVQKWDGDAIDPKPSPTIQLLYQNQFTEKQLQGYKLLLGLKSYLQTRKINPLAFFKHYKKQWKQSERWAKELSK